MKPSNEKEVTTATFLSYIKCKFLVELIEFLKIVLIIQVEFGNSVNHNKIEREKLFNVTVFKVFLPNQLEKFLST